MNRNRYHKCTVGRATATVRLVTKLHHNMPYGRIHKLGNDGGSKFVDTRERSYTPSSIFVPQNRAKTARSFCTFVGSAICGGPPQPMSVSNSAKLAVPSMGPLRVTAIAPLAQA